MASVSSEETDTETASVNSDQGDVSGVELTDFLHSLLITEDGCNIGEILQGIQKGIDTQNKILLKLGGLIDKYLSS